MKTIASLPNKDSIMFKRVSNTKRNLVLVVLSSLFFTISLPVLAESFSQEQICKTAIGKIMGKNPIIIKALKSESGITRLSYIREVDGTKWSYRCKLEGNKVIWATDTGRWRTDPQDDVITYSVGQGSIEIVEKYPDGSSAKESYTTAQIGK